jgi:hypothetical protein
MGDTMKKILILSLLLSVGCAKKPPLEPQIRDYINKFKGKHYSYAIEQMGAYERSISIGDSRGGTIYIWKEYTGTSYEGGAKYYATFQLFCDSEGIVYKTLFEKEGEGSLRRLRKLIE